MVEGFSSKAYKVMSLACQSALHPSVIGASQSLPGLNTGWCPQHTPMIVRVQLRHRLSAAFNWQAVYRCQRMRLRLCARLQSPS